MKQLLLLSVLASMAVANSPPAKGFRLIQTQEDEPAFWVSPKVAHLLTESSVAYFDLTEIPSTKSAMAPESIYAIPSAPSHQTEVFSLFPLIDMSYFEGVVRHLSSYNNRYYDRSTTGVASATWIYEEALGLIQQANRSDVTVSYFSHSFDQPSIIVKMPGSVGGDLVVVGGHQDSTAPGMPTGSAPGADDDATGSATVLEVLRILLQANFRPQLDIEFHWYAGEEAGLLGSNLIATNYANNDISIRATCNFDMTGYNQAVSPHIAIITDFTDAELNEFMRQLVDEYCDIPWVDDKCLYACSDHASWYRNGYKATHPFEALNLSPYIHTPRDTIDTVDMEHSFEFVKLGVGYVVELSYI